MAINLIVLYQLTCDWCKKSNEPLLASQLPETTWRLNEYMQSPGYRYYAMTCSDECHKEWETRYLDLLHLTSRGPIGFDGLDKWMRGDAYYMSAFGMPNPFFLFVRDSKGE